MVDIKDRLSTFHGGLMLKHHKAMSVGHDVITVPFPETLYISLRVNRGHVSEPTVKVGDRVKAKQVIAQPVHPFGAVVHAPCSGIVAAIETRATAAPDAEQAPCIILTTDPQNNQSQPMSSLDEINRQTLIERIQEAGILGMGGAGFPTHVKYDHQTQDMDTMLIINGAECEPYISCDERLMLDEPEALIEGTELLMKAADAQQAVIAIEDNLGGVKALLDKTIQALGRSHIKVIKVPTIYPTGGEKQLIKVLTGLEVPSGQTPLSLGIIMQNVATTKAVYDAVKHNQSLTHRLVTVTGDAVGKPSNYLTPIGTPFSHILSLAQCDLSRIDKLVIGGPMMGYPMPNTDIGVDKTTNCLLLLTPESTKPDLNSLPCIRCGDCVKACPQDLLPQQLFWYAQGENLEETRNHHVFDCIECGACSWVCPSHIDLVSYYRYAKSELSYLDYKKAKAQLAKKRHENRQQRLEAIKAERQAKRRAKTNKLKDKKNAKKEISAVLDRIKNKNKAEDDSL